MIGAHAPTVVLLLWGDLFEDFHDTIDVSIEDFRTQLTGGWLFGYVDALHRAGVRVVMLQVSARVVAPLRFVHEPTGAAVVLLPQPRRHRLARWIAVRLPSRLPVRKAVSAVTSWLSIPLRATAREVRRVGAVALLTQEYEHARFDVLVVLGHLLGLPVFASFQGGDRPSSRLEAVLRPRMVRAAAGLIIASGRERQRVRRAYGVPEQRLSDIPNGLDLTEHRPMGRAEARARLGIAQDATVVEWHGRIEVHRKGLDVLCEAWELVLRDRPGTDLLLLLVGTGPDAERFRVLVDALPDGSVLWHDAYVNDRGMLRLYPSAADVYVLPSRHEGFPVAPLEALAAGLPLVAADAPGIRDILVDGERSGGVVVPVADAAALAEALGGLIDDPVRRRRLGAAAARRSEAFSLELVGARLRDLLVDDAGRVH